MGGRGKRPHAARARPCPAPAHVDVSSPQPQLRSQARTGRDARPVVALECTVGGGDEPRADQLGVPSEGFLTERSKSADGWQATDQGRLPAARGVTRRA